MTVTVRQLAQLVNGIVVGAGDTVIENARTLQDAQAGDITFVENAGLAAKLDECKASAAVVRTNVNVPGRTLIQVADPLMAFVAMVQHFQGNVVQRPTGIDPRAFVDPSAKVGPDASIAPFACIGANTSIGPRACIHANVVVGQNCTLGADVVLHPGVVLYDNCICGDRVILHAHAVIGADGFGYRFQNGKHVKVPQLGNVVLGNDVEIGAGTTIDRGAFQSTCIGDGTKIDNLVQVAHNCKIGKHNAIAALVGIAGSTTTGSYVLMGGQSGVKDHITIGDGALVGAGSGVIHDIPPRGRVFGYPAQQERDAGRTIALLKRLPEMRKELLRVLKYLGLSEQKDAA